MKQNLLLSVLLVATNTVAGVYDRWPACKPETPLSAKKQEK